MTLEINTLLNAGNFQVSIGRQITDVAIFSKASGEAVELHQAKRSLRFKAIKRKFKANLASQGRFFFEHMQPEQTTELIAMLKKR